MKKIIYFLLIIPFLSCNTDNDKTDTDSLDFKGELVWSKTYGGSLDDRISSVALTQDGGTIVVGYTNSNDGDISKRYALQDVWISKYNADGNLIWSKTIGGSQNDYGTSIIATTDGNFVVAGFTGSNDGDVPGNIGMHDFYISKINGDGDIIWSKNYGFSSHDHAHKIIQTRDGGFFVAGYADYSGIEGSGDTGDHGEGHSLKNAAKHGVGEYFGIKLDANGNFKWYRYYGGTQNDRVNDIVETNDGGMIMAGYSESVDFDITDNKGSYDFWVLKLDSSGHLHWKANYGGSGIDQAFGIAKTDNNSYLIAGKSNSVDGQVSMSKGNFDAWIIHINDHGELLWEKSFGGTEFDAANTIRKLSNGSFAVVGSSRSTFPETQNHGDNDYWFFEIDNKANTGLHWQKTFGGQGIDIAYDLAETKNNELVLVGESESSTFDVPYNKGFNDLWIIKVK